MSAHDISMQVIIDGESPAGVFRRCLLADPSLSNADLSALFMEQFDLVSTEALHVIWNWQRPGSDRGLEDRRIDELLFHYLVEAGYQVRHP